MLTKIKKIIMGKKSKKEEVIKVDHSAIDSKIAKLKDLIKKLEAKKK